MNNIQNRFLKKIHQLPRNRGKIQFAEVKKTFEDLYYKSYPQNEYDEKLMEILMLFKIKELLLFPKGEQYWDMTKSTPRPLWIKLPSEKKDKKLKSWKNEVWGPQMSWVTQINRMTSKTHEDLRMIDDFLKIPKDDISFPEKERSIKLFGNEKRLRELQTTFGKKIDLFALTNSYKTHKPLSYKIFSSISTIAIIIENRDTFDSFCRANSLLKSPRYQYVIFGDGLEILERYYDILRFEEVPQNIEYFGDIDPTGLYIAQHLQKQLRTDECQLTLQFSPFYERLLELYKKQNWKFKFETQNSPFTLDFVPPSDQEYILSLFCDNNRIPQELLNIEEIMKIFKEL